MTTGANESIGCLDQDGAVALNGRQPDRSPSRIGVGQPVVEVIDGSRHGDPALGEVQHHVCARVEVLRAEDAADTHAAKRRRGADDDDLGEGEVDLADTDRDLVRLPRGNGAASAVGPGFAGLGGHARRLAQVDRQQVVACAGVEDEASGDAVDDGFARVAHASSRQRSQR